MAVERFGSFGGAPVERVTLSAHGLTARVMTWGAVLQDLRLDPHPHPLVLGFDRFDLYPERSPSFGAIVGRVANRIAGGQAEIGGRAYRFDRNFLGRHTLHGGSDGSGRRLWRIAEAGADFVTLAIALPDGHMGFPGNLEARASYRILPGPALSIEIGATADAETVCNFAHHSYWNLDGTASALDHLLRIDAADYLATDDELIPTDVLPVAGSPFDFRAARPLGGEGALHDLNFCLSDAAQALRQVAALTGPRSGLTMAIETTEPGLQLYDGANIPAKAGDAPGLGGTPYGAFAGIALEPQRWPDAPNRAWAPQVRLVPGQEYRQHSVFRFGMEGNSG